MFYLDYNATSLIRPFLKQHISDMLDVYGNPSSVHSFGRKAKSILETARESIAQYCQVLPQSVIFTASATEANHLIIRGTDCDVFITSPAEHDCVLSAIRTTQKPVYYLKHHLDGSVDIDSFNQIMEDIVQKKQKPFFSLMKVNNETGILNVLDYFHEKIRSLNGIIHTDAVQAFGKIPFDSWSWQVDAITVAAHKVGGLKGVGVLIIKQGFELLPLLTGGGQEMRRRAGTENLLAVSAMGKLTEYFSDISVFNLEQEQIKNLRDSLEVQIKQMNPVARIIGHDSNIRRVANTCCVITPNLESEKQVIIADLNKVAISAGSACSSGKVKQSHVLKAYGFSDDLSACSTRVSLGFASQESDINAFIKAYAMITQKAQK